MPLSDEATRLLESCREGSVLVLTGAGISAESGIPTFRGSEGYWVEGSTHYQPMELATAAAFERVPETVWAWYLHRRAVCRAARPNAAHDALVRLEQAFGSRFLLVTQNVDGLHLRAGNTPERTYCIHGDIDRMRCARECDGRIVPIPDDVPTVWPRGRALDPETARKLVCPTCGGRARPHVLWFDESYDEPRFRFESTRRASMSYGLLIVVGTTGATNLPLQVGYAFARRRAPMLVINPEENPFSELLDRGVGAYVAGTAGDLVPRTVDVLLGG